MPKEKVSETEKSRAALLNILEDTEEARNKLEIERNKTAAIIANFVDPVLVVDNDWRLILFNPAAERVLKISKDALGAKIYSASRKFSFNSFKEVVKVNFESKIIELDKNKNSKIEEVTLKNEAGTNNPVYKVMTAVIYDDHAATLGMMKIFYDLTREKMIDKMKSEFISIAAHQLRTPLSAIKWVIKMVLDGDAGKISKEQQDLLLKGYNSNERIIRLVNDLLNVSRIEEGRFGYNFVKCKFDGILNEVISNNEQFLAKNHLKLTIDKPKKLTEIFLDKEKIILAIQNILDNAIKYTPEYGKIEIKITQDEKNMKVSIKDNGIGIPEQDKIKLFSKFFRGANAVRLETEGTGLGIFIVKNIIEKHNGRISVASQEGKGTEVIFSLPLNNNNNNN